MTNFFQISFNSISQNNKKMSDKFSLSPLQQIQLNQQQIKLYISVCEQPVPDIVNQCDDGSIYSHFRFYFNDDSLAICMRRTGEKGGEEVVSAMHVNEFQQRVQSLFDKWRKIGANATSDKLIKGNKKQNELQLQPHEQKDGSQNVHKNFIAFVQYWVRNSPELVIRYSVYTELVSECIQNFLNNSIMKIAFSRLAPKKPFNLKSQPKPHRSPHRPLQPDTPSLSNPIIQRRLRTYFIHFSKLQNLCPNSSNPLYRNNDSKTFDEIVKIYSTVNLQQWVSFVKVFGFEKIFEEGFKKYGGENQATKGNRKVENTRNYLPVRNVKWSSSLQYFKNLFEKFCDNSKNLDFEAFEKIIKRLFQQLFSSSKDSSLPESTNPNPPTPISPTSHENSSPQKTGIIHLKLLTQSQFNTKLRSLGIFVSQNPTTIFSPVKTYSSAKPRYLQQPSLPALSSVKIRQGKTHQPQSRSVMLPSIEKSKEKLYTLEGLMASRKEEKQNANIGKFSVGIPINPLRQNTTIQNSTILTKKSVQKHPLKQSLGQPQQKPQKSGFLKQICHEIEEEPDQYLAQYYNKDMSTSNVTKSRQPGKIGKQGSNIMRRLDERIERVHRRML